MGNHMSVDRLQQRLYCCFAGESCELMVHPGYRCRGLGGCGPEGADDFARSIDREHELVVVTSYEMTHFYEQQQLLLTDRIIWIYIVYSILASSVKCISYYYNMIVWCSLQYHCLVKMLPIQSKFYSCVCLSYVRQLSIKSSFISYTWYMSCANIVSINIQNKLRRGKKYLKKKYDIVSKLCLQNSVIPTLLRLITFRSSELVLSCRRLVDEH